MGHFGSAQKGFIRLHPQKIREGTFCDKSMIQRKLMPLTVFCQFGDFFTSRKTEEAVSLVSSVDGVDIKLCLPLSLEGVSVYVTPSAHCLWAAHTKSFS